MSFINHETAIIQENVTIGDRTRIGPFCFISADALIGSDCTFGQNVHVDSCVKIGNHCKIQNNASIYEGVVLEDFVFCGPSCCFANDATPRSKYPKGEQACMQSVVREGASIGANAVIITGNTIGRHAMIGAGAVVTRPVPDHALMTGVPARQIGWVCECGVQLNKNLLCDTCGRQYEYNPDGKGLRKARAK